MQVKINKFFRIIQTYYYFKVLLLHQVAVGVEHAAIFNYLCSERFQTVVDIGANRGQFALIARKYFPDAKVVSFEPLPEPAAIFHRVFASDPKVALHEVAIGPEDRDMTIYVSRADDSSSLLPISSVQSRLFPGTEKVEERTVTVRRLESVLKEEDIQPPALLKIDVQGFELEVLEGCRSLLPCFSFVYVECSFVELYAGQALAHEVIAYLQGTGFVLAGVYNLYYDKKGISVQGDFLFVRNS